jgi:putative membrane protein insertion efficiency factor
LGKKIFILVLGVYRTFLSPFLPGSCRFIPSCSKYAEDAIARWGVMKGLELTVRRLLHCHPGHPGGYDPAP